MALTGRSRLTWFWFLKRHTWQLEYRSNAYRTSGQAHVSILMREPHTYKSHLWSQSMIGNKKFSNHKMRSKVAWRIPKYFLQKVVVRRLLSFVFCYKSNIRFGRILMIESVEVSASWNQMGWQSTAFTGDEWNSSCSYSVFDEKRKSYENTPKFDSTPQPHVSQNA